MKHGLTRVLMMVGLGTLIHLDWHLARPAHHRLSGDFAQHWLLALPVFAGLAVWLVRKPLTERWRESAIVIVGGVLAGQVAEMSFEVVAYGLPLAHLLDGPRWTVLSEFLAAGALTLLVIMALAAPGRISSASDTQ